MLRISQPDDVEQSDSLLEVDQRRKQVSIQQPKNPNFIPPKLQTANNAVPKLFGFDAIFEPEMLPVSFCYITKHYFDIFFYFFFLNEYGFVSLSSQNCTINTNKILSTKNCPLNRATLLGQ